MRPLTILTASFLLACGPGTPSDADSSTGHEPTTSGAPGTTTAAPDTTTSLPTTSLPTTTDTSTTDTATTSENESSTKIDGLVIAENCDIFLQDCAPGQKCVPWADDGGSSWNATRCVPITGDGAPDDPCTAPNGPLNGSDDCALGAFCWDVDDENNGTCIALCGGTPEAPSCPPNTHCAISGEGVLNLCIKLCDPLLQDCPDDDLCLPTNDVFTCTNDASGDMGQVNDPCEFANACDEGLVCLNTASASIACDQNSRGCCQPFCEFPNSPCPNPDQQCLQWFDPMMEIPEGLEDVGVCAIPP